MGSAVPSNRHPIQAMLIFFTVVLWAASFLCDIVATGSSKGTFWSDIAFYTMAAGVVGALLAAIPDFFNYLDLAKGTVRRLAMRHLVLNMAIIVLYVFNLGLRMNRPAGSEPAVLLSGVAIGLLAIRLWLGGKLESGPQVVLQPEAIDFDHDRNDLAA